MRLCVCKNSSRRLARWAFRRDSKIFLSNLICLSHTPTMLLAVGGFLFNDIPSPPLSSINWLIFWWFISVKDLVSSAEGPTKLVPLSDLISLTFPLWPVNLGKHIRKQKVLKEFVALVWVAWLDRRVSNVPYRFSSLDPLFIPNGPKTSTPQ